ncbi:MAG TPA: acyltransferase family protein [Jiangellaceae bacterium]|nr:acyltransferase family protein [Jiangellaceae bacterium]
MHNSSATAVRPAPLSTSETRTGNTAPTAAGVGSEFRGDIQGLRAVAVLLVLGFHAGVPLLSGGFVGVDVFFVISGFLITGLIVREVRRTGRLSLSRFWARRARRLLPATAVVLGAVAVMTILLLPVTRWSSVAWDIATSALYVVNWRLADQSVNYLVSEDAPSPLQHFWSLAVEEQFYLVWPLLIIFLLWVQRRFRLSLTKVLIVGSVAIALPSLAWSAFFTETSAAQAYFVSTTRLWELAIGASLAIVAHRLRHVPMVLAQALGLLGLGAIAYAAVSFDAGTSFPGIAALLPTLGTAAVLIAGGVERRTAATVLLDTPPMRDIGTLSYSLYLWHWPLLVGAAVVFGRDDGTLSVPLGLLVVGFSAVPAWLTYRIIEEPFHHARMFVRFPARAAVLGATCTAVGVAAAIVVSFSVPQSAASADRAAPGAAVLGDDPTTDPDGQPVDTVEYIVPDVLQAEEYRATLDGRTCINVVTGTEMDSCSYGPDDADITVAVAGDSKMDQYLPALQQIAEKHQWRLVTYLKSACPLVRVPVERGDKPNEDCATYNETRYEALLQDNSIDYVITSQRLSLALAGSASEDERLETMVDGHRDTWQLLEDDGKDVIVVLDNPYPQLDVMECVATYDHKLTECAFPRDDGDTRGGAPAQLAALERSPHVASVDVRDFICPGDICPAVIGNTLVYRRGSHLTTTYVESLTPRLDEALTAAMELD